MSIQKNTHHSHGPHMHDDDDIAKNRDHHDLNPDLNADSSTRPTNILLAREKLVAREKTQQNISSNSKRKTYRILGIKTTYIRVLYYASWPLGFIGTWYSFVYAVHIIEPAKTITEAFTYSLWKIVPTLLGIYILPSIASLLQKRNRDKYTNIPETVASVLFTLSLILAFLLSIPFLQFDEITVKSVFYGMNFFFWTFGLFFPPGIVLFCCYKALHEVENQGYIASKNFLWLLFFSTISWILVICFGVLIIL